MTDYGPYDGQFISAHDGDTFTAVVSSPTPYDFGFHVKLEGSAQQKFRLNRCNAAPLGTPSGDGAHQYLIGMLSLGFTLVSVGPYKYGDEWMAEVTLADGRNVSDVMIAEQWAAPWNGVGGQPLPPWPRTVA